MSVPPNWIFDRILYIPLLRTHLRYGFASSFNYDNYQLDDYWQEVLNELAKNTAPTFEEKVELSDRQKEILIKIGEGFSTKQIAEALFISEHTVGTHRRNLLKKYNVPNDNHLVRIAIRLGFVKP